MDPAPREVEDMESILDRIARELASARPSTRCCRRAYEPGSTIEGLEELEELLRECRVVFLNLYTPTCPYCHLFRPVFSEVGKRFRGAAAFVSIDVARYPEAAWSLGITSTPATVIFVGGRPVNAVIGYIPRQSFEELVLEVLRRAGCAS